MAQELEESVLDAPQNDSSESLEQFSSSSETDLLSLEESDSDTDPDSEAISTTIIQEIEDGTYICLICTCELDRESEIWSCQECYRVYDLDCIKDWAVKGSSTTENKRWRCPACNYEHSKIPKKFTCWCGRVQNPKRDSTIPFSCGNICNAKHTNCVHSCSSICHPGEHPQCGALGPALQCHCGKFSQQLPCLVTPYEVGWACDTPCDVQLCALGHKCPSSGCHSGFCGPCQQTVSVTCYCGNKTLGIECSSIIPKTCVKDGVTFLGAAACDQISIQPFDCGIHEKELGCSPMPTSAPHCPYSPDVVKSCYCGKTARKSLDRVKCTDPMPECEQRCDKPLPCGCKCMAKCHEGPCECHNILEKKCSCGNSSYLVPCKAVQQGFVPKCHHKCTALLSCRKHWHRAECCEYEQAALKRERETKKQLRNRMRSNFDDQIFTMESPHICTRTCNQMRSCQKHRCQALCHTGPCGSCLESSNEDLVCNCGKTVIPAPVRCGSKVECQEQCIRAKACGHLQELHRCHEDNKQCPRCTAKVSKRCQCGAKIVQNVLCSVDTISCGKICVEQKECGHPCNRACSRDCTNGIHAPLAACQSMCKNIKDSCPHMCKAKCHYWKHTPCDLQKCKDLVTIHCSCGRLSRNVTCDASVTNKSRIGTLLECDDECVMVKREEELRAAFNMGTKPSWNSYSEDILKVFRRQGNWCSKYENELRTFLSNFRDLQAAGSSPKNSLHLPPMTKPQRKFIHELASTYRLYSESQDSEPKRSVFVCVTNASSLPSMSLKETTDLQDEIEKKRLLFESLNQSDLENGFFNAILISDVYFGVSKDDIERTVNDVLTSFPEIENPQIHWIKDSTFAFHCDNFKNMEKQKEDKLYILSQAFRKSLKEKYIAFDCKMCMVDDAVTLVLKTDTVNHESLNEDNKSQLSKNKYSILEEETVV